MNHSQIETPIGRSCNFTRHAGSLFTEWITERWEKSYSTALVAFVSTMIAVSGALHFNGLLEDLSGDDDCPGKLSRNPCYAEAKSLLDGSIELPKRLHDSAVHKKHYYNVFQSGQTLFFLGHLWVNPTRGLRYFPLEMVFLMLLSVAFFFCGVFKLSNGNSLIAACLTISFFGGAPYLASFPSAMQGYVCRVNHCFSILFFAMLFVVVSAPLTFRRCLLASLCIGLSMLFRIQNIILIILPILPLVAGPYDREWRIRQKLSRRPERRQLVNSLLLLVCFPLLAGLLFMGVNLAKFGNPLNTGYQYLYIDRTDYIALRARTYGMMSFEFLPENLFRTFWSAPAIEFDGWRIMKIMGDRRGNSLIFSQPILIIICFLGGAFRFVRMKAFLATSLLLAVPVWLYHNPGVFGRGYMRLSLDYAPIWFSMLAIGVALCKPRTPLFPVIAVTGTIWSLFYAYMLLQS